MKIKYIKFVGELILILVKYYHMYVIRCPKCSEESVDLLAPGTYKCKRCGVVFSDRSCSAEGKNKVVAGLLGIFLGGLGIHKFYLGSIYTGIFYILFCWTFIPALIGFIEGIMYLCMSDEAFAEKYDNNKGFV